MHLKLVRPSFDYADQVINFKAEMLLNHDSLDGCAGLEEVDCFEEWIDFDIDKNRTAKRGEYVVLSKPESKVTVVVMPTNEELVIARDAIRLGGLQ